MTTAPCYGKSDLFLSLFPSHHIEARQICADCPLINECRRRRDIDPYSNEGTWAGELWKDGRRIRAAEIARQIAFADAPNIAESCADCHIPIPRTRKRCKTCADRKARSLRAASRNRVFGEVNDRHCSHCGAEPLQPCTSPKTGRTGYMHTVRRGKTCDCGSPVAPGRRDHCEPCYAIHRREFYRLKSERWRRRQQVAS